MMVTPLSWNFLPYLMQRFNVQRRFCLVELKYTDSMIFSVSLTRIGRVEIIMICMCFYSQSVFLIHLSLV